MFKCAFFFEVYERKSGSRRQACAIYRHDDVYHACKMWQDDQFVLFSSGVVFDTTPAGTQDGIRSSSSSYIDWSKNRWYVTTVQNWVDAGLPAIA
jgi:hypothetical protein